MKTFTTVIDINIRTLKAHINNKFYPRLNFRWKKKNHDREKKCRRRRKIVPTAESYRKYIMIMINWLYAFISSFVYNGILPEFQFFKDFFMLFWLDLKFYCWLWLFMIESWLSIKGWGLFQMIKSALNFLKIIPQVSRVMLRMSICALFSGIILLFWIMPHLRRDMKVPLFKLFFSS